MDKQMASTKFPLFTQAQVTAEWKAVHELTEIEEHFRRFKKAVDKYKIKPANYWNFDETGWRVGCLQGRVVFTFSKVAAVYMSDPDTRESITSIEAINAAGEAALSMLILPRVILLEPEFGNV